MLSRVYRIPKGRFCSGTTKCPFMVFGNCSHFMVELQSVWAGQDAYSFALLRLTKCLNDFPYGGIVTVDVEGPSRADVSEATPTEEAHHDDGR